jgi:hypothetical protein
VGRVSGPCVIVRVSLGGVFVRWLGRGFALSAARLLSLLDGPGLALFVVLGGLACPSVVGWLGVVAGVPLAV